jgi:hypothetical protein
LKPCSQKNIVPPKLVGTINRYVAPFASVPLHVSTPAAVAQTGAAAVAEGVIATLSVSASVAAPSVAIDLRIVSDFM